MQKTALAIVVMAVAALPPASRASAQDSSGAPAALTIDDNLVKKGKSLWTSKACSGCHTIGKGKIAGPDLAHLNDRRSLEWTQKWLQNTNAMLDNDETAKALFEEYNKVRMPDFKMKEEEALAVIHYIAKESQKVKKK